MKKIIFSKKIFIQNPYKLVEKSVFINLYSLYSNISLRSNNKLIKALAYGVYLLSSLIGQLKLSLAINRSLKVGFQDGLINRLFHLRDTNSQFHSIYFNRYKLGYEPDVVAAINIFLPKNGKFVDIGSNWGHHSVYSALFKKANIIAFEPNYKVYSDINNIFHELQIPKSQYKLYNQALSNFEGEIKLNQNYFESGIASIEHGYTLRTKNIHLEMVNKIFLFKKNVMNVQVNTLDSYVVEYPNLIKIDAEGVELEILQGSQNTINQYSPIIIFEYHSVDNFEMFDQFRQFFESIDYNLYGMQCNYDSNDLKFLFEIYEIHPEINTQYNMIAIPKKIDINKIKN